MGDPARPGGPARPAIQPQQQQPFARLLQGMAMRQLQHRGVQLDSGKRRPCEVEGDEADLVNPDGAIPGNRPGS